MKKADIEKRWEYATWYPAINVKWWPYWPDIVKKYRGSDEHEFGHDELFWAWLDEQYAQDREWPHGPFHAAEESTREDGWDTAQNDIDAVFEGTRFAPKVESSGRSSGWLIVKGLGDIDDWDAVMVARWARCIRYIRQDVADLDWQFVWHLHWQYENDDAYNPDAGFQLTLEDA